MTNRFGPAEDENLEYVFTPNRVGRALIQMYSGIEGESYRAGDVGLTPLFQKLLTPEGYDEYMIAQDPLPGYLHRNIGKSGEVSIVVNREMSDRPDYDPEFATIGKLTVARKLRR